MANKAVNFNKKAHDAVATDYENIHSEIFNPIEQERLQNRLKKAYNSIQTHSPTPLKALDYGAGSGNITRYLLRDGFQTTAADVSKKFLELITNEHANTPQAQLLNTELLNGENMHDTPGSTYDLITTYSVLHHIPDYLAAINELVRVLKPGGVLFMDHEHSAEHWLENPQKQDFLARVQPPRIKHWTRFLKWSNWNFHIRRLFNPRYEPEGDIHVWPDDHIEWNLIQQLVESLGCEVLLNEKYLLFKGTYNEEVYNEYKDSLTDMQLMIVRKKAA